jgi:carbamoyl-phosphate synthase small subunit
LQATLLLEDGTKLPGKAAGAPGVTMGELCICSGHDALHRMTDPASAGQVCAFTQPAVGRWGVNTENCETGSPWMRGLIAREIAALPSNWRSAETLDFFLRRCFIPAIEGIDTRELSRYSAEKNIKRCAIVASPDFTGWDALLSQVKSFRYDNTFPAAVKAPVTHGSGKNANVAICDFGSSLGLTRLLTSMRVRVTLLPPYDAATIVSREGFDALIIPNGAGSPRSHPGITEGIRGLIAEGVPIMGFGLGFRFIAQAAGAALQPMAKPHRGSWFPVVDLRSQNIIYTWQNHGLDLTGALPENMRVTHRNVSDGTPEGFVIENKPISAFHYLPCDDIRLGGTGEMFACLFDLLKKREGAPC